MYDFVHHSVSTGHQSKSLLVIYDEDGMMYAQGHHRVKKCGVDIHGEGMKREPIIGVCGWSPQLGPGAANLLHSPYFANSLNPRLL